MKKKVFISFLLSFKTVELVMAGSAFRAKLRFKSIENFRVKDITGTPPAPDDLATLYGYKAETHSVTSPDGYILGLYRVQNSSVRVTEPFILQHGLTCNAGQWMVLEPSQNLALMLADAGYDVWLSNIRGTMFSRKHATLSPESAEFWNYGWHEHGIIDMPTIIDYILAKTGYKQLFYVGHSMGTTMFFVMGSMRPEYNDRIKHMFALAPVAYCGNMQSPPKALAPNVRLLQEILKSTFNNHIPSEVIIVQLGKMGFCSVGQSVCGSFIDSIGGINPRSNTSVQEAFMRYFPDAPSSKQLAHYAQQINNPNTFRLFDYYEENTQKYGSSTPPEYPVHKISTPMTFFYSNNDFLTNPKDIEKFSQKLKNVKLFLVDDPKFNHFDYVISTYANELVYMPLIKIANSYRSQQ